MTEGTDPYPYRRRRRPGSARKRKVTRPKKGDRPRVSLPLTGVTRAGLPVLIVLGLAGFFLGRAVLLGELMPFGPALVAATVRCRRQAGLWVTLAVEAGIITQAPSSVPAGHLLAVGLVFVLLSLLPERMPRAWLVVPGVTAASVLIIQTAFLAFNSPSTYAYITVLFDAVFAGILTQLFVLVFAPLFNLENPRPLTAEELFSLLVLFAGLITGAGSYSWWLLSLRGIESRFFVVLAAFLGGPGLGAAVGALVGVVPGLAFGTAQGLVNAYAFVGLIAGLCQGFGRLGVAFGFLLGNIVLSIYTSNFASFASALAESGIALLLYLVFPENLTDLLRLLLANILPAGERPHREEDRAQAFLAQRVRGWAGIFHELARAFGEVSASTPEENRLQAIIDRVAATVCHGCSLHQTCWEREFYRTYQNLRDLVSEAENFRPGQWQVPEETRRRCPRYRELGIAVLSSYTTSRLEHGWDQKLQQERDIVALQMEALAGMLESLATRVEEAADWVPPPLPTGLTDKLKKKGLTVLSLTMEGTDGNYAEAAVDLSPCPLKANCWQEIAGFLHESLAVRFYPATRQCLCQEGDPSCRLRLYPQLRFRLSLGVAVRARDGSDISGDSFAILPLSDGRMALILSDGMGTGPAAARESKAATRLLSDLLQADFSPEVAVRTVNASLLLQKPEESFTTIDMAIVDLYGGEVAFIKVGAPPSFVGRPKRVSVIQANSLPAGIIHDIEVTTACRTLTAGDYLVLATDGVFDAHPDGGQDMWLAGLLQEITDVHPRELADLILNLASQKPPRDDQAVLVARLEEN